VNQGQPPVVTVDGPSGSGKGTVSRQLAVRLGWHYLDSGALYRLVALAALRKRIDLGDANALGALAAGLNVRFAPASELERVYLDDTEVAAELPCPLFGPLCCSASATSHVGRASWPTAATWAALFSPPRR
jgi:cytidylate kinase